MTRSVMIPSGSVLNAGRTISDLEARLVAINLHSMTGCRLKSRDNIVHVCTILHMYDVCMYVCMFILVFCLLEPDFSFFDSGNSPPTGIASTSR